MSAAATQSQLNSYRGIFTALLAFRLANALTLRTFFQPDEFFQSLEVAVDLAFGPHSQAWITWEWKNHLRSSLHPAIFAAGYQLTTNIASICGITPCTRAQLLLLAPKVIQALFAALLDCYTWRLAERAYGPGSRTAFSAVCSPGITFTASISDICLCPFLAHAVYFFPVAMVLFNTNPVQLPGDNSHGNGSLLLALALVRACKR
jgi:phosphatidylinositol glycan class B